MAFGCVMDHVILRWQSTPNRSLNEAVFYRSERTKILTPCTEVSCT